MKKFTNSFKDLSKNDASIAGGKGASLGEMTKTGIPVPPGFVVLAGAFEQFCEETDLDVEIDAILHTVNHKEIHTVEEASEKIQALIIGSEMPVDITKEVKEKFKILNAKYVAVRSSATSEDSSEAAWAGQLDSFLNTTEEKLLENVKRCWASLFTPRAIFYRFEKELHKTKISVAVVIQKMVESEVSGIAFSVHPVTEDYNQLIIEAGLGLGEAIVSGQITPDSYVVEKEPRNIIDINISEQDRGLYKVLTGGNEWRDLGEKGKKQKLSGKQILELSEIILRIEKHYGFPSDIEWALEKEKFYIVQSRPITTLSNKKGKKEEIWIRNYSAEPCSWQLCTAMIDFWPYGQKILGKSPLCLTSHFVQYQGSVCEGGYSTDKDLTNFAEVLTRMIYEEPEKIIKNHKESYRLNKKYFDLSRKIYRSDLSKFTNRELAKCYEDLTIAQEMAHMHSIGTTWFVDSHGATFVSSLIKRTEELISERGSTFNPAEIFSILTTPPKNSFAIEEEIESLSIVEKILKDRGAKKIFTELRNYNEIPKDIAPILRKAMEKHCEKWSWIPFGYRGPAYGMDYYLSVWAGLVRERTPVVKLIKEKKNRPKEIAKERKILLKKLSVPASLQKVYDIAADITFLKGYRKDCCYMGFYVIDKIFREVAKRLKISTEDIHMLMYKEISEMLQGKKRFDKDEISRRKISGIMIWEEGKPSRVISGQEAKDFLASKKIKEDIVEIGADEFRGTCACSGYAKGIIKIVNKPEEMNKMNQGDIMVAHTTFPALVPAMKKASAIVTEDGGITCHAAIVARELKTPCVTGIKVITKVVKDGDLVEVDADKGIVKIIKKVDEN